MKGQSCFSELDKDNTFEYEVRKLKKNEIQQEKLFIKLSETYLSFAEGNKT